MIVSFRVSQNLFHFFSISIFLGFINDFKRKIESQLKSFLGLSTVQLFQFFLDEFTFILQKSSYENMSVSLLWLLSGFRLCAKNNPIFSSQRGETKFVSKSRTKANLSKKSFSTILKQVQKLIHFLSSFHWLHGYLMIIRENTRWVCRMNWFTNLSFNYKEWIYWLFNTWSVFATLSISNFLHDFAFDVMMRRKNVIMLCVMCKHQ